MTESDRSTNSKAVKIVFITSITAIVLVLIFFFYSVFNLLRYDRIYKGVFVYNTNASDMTKQELITRLKSNHINEINNISITLKSGDFTVKHYLSDFDLQYDFEKIANTAYSVGREGSIPERIKSILSASFKDVHIYPDVLFDSSKIDNLVDDFYNNTLVIMEEFSYSIKEGILILNTGHDGKSIDKDYLKNIVISFLNDRNTLSLEIDKIINEKPEVSFSSLAAVINRDPVNAQAKVINNEIVISTHEYGYKVDDQSLVNAVNRINTSEYETITLDIDILEPEITEAQLNSKLFSDTLASYKTSYSTADQLNMDREINLKLASGKINGKILAPGEIFSFNNVVGERSVANGYRDAYVFVGGKMVEGLGGGICQVSSTLYNAALLANLKIVERVNHMFVVNYVNKGLDATVVYGAIDFRFENSTKWPIKITAYLFENNLYVILNGTNDNKNISVSLFSEVVSSTPFKTVYIDDPNMKEGETRVLQSGINGYVVNAFKTISTGSGEAVTSRLSTNNYIPLDQRVARGPVKEVIEEEPDIVPDQVAVETESNED